MDLLSPSHSIVQAKAIIKGDREKYDMNRSEFQKSNESSIVETDLEKRDQSWQKQ